MEILVFKALRMDQALWTEQEDCEKESGPEKKHFDDPENKDLNTENFEKKDHLDEKKHLDKKEIDEKNLGDENLDNKNLDDAIANLLKTSSNPFSESPQDESLLLTLFKTGLPSLIRLEHPEITEYVLVFRVWKTMSIHSLITPEPPVAQSFRV